LNRKYFDNLLLKKALKKGVIFRRNSTVISPLFNRDFINGYRYDTKWEKTREMKAKIIVSAEGAGSIFTRIVSKFDHKRIIRAVNVICKAKPVRKIPDSAKGRNNADYLKFFFNDSILPGYYWVFPFISEGIKYNIGFGADKRCNLKEYLDV